MKTVLVINNQIYKVNSATIRKVSRLNKLMATWEERDILLRQIINTHKPIADINSYYV